MTDEKKEYNPFEGMDGNTTPGELLQALMKKAINDNDLRPVGGVVGMLQKQVEATMQHLGAVMQRLREEVGQTSMITDVTRLTIALIIKLLISKEIVDKEEFEKLYKEQVTDVMDKHIKDVQKQQEEMEAKQKQEVEDFAKKAAEGEEVVDPNSGEVISDLEPVEEVEEAPFVGPVEQKETEHPSIDPVEKTKEE